jgi:hypothetical protein
VGRGRGKPYIFVNFGYWRGNIVKLTIWSEGLAQLSDWPDDRWVGRWVSVVGLVDAPYSGKHYDFHYTHVGITIDNPQQINVIAEIEASFRLGQKASTPIRAVEQAPRQGKPTRAGSSSNQNIINGLTEKNTPRPIAPARRNRAPARGTTNQDILRGIQRIPSTPARPAPPRSVPRSPTSPPTATPTSLLKRMLRLIGLSR